MNYLSTFLAQILNAMTSPHANRGRAAVTVGFLMSGDRIVVGGLAGVGARLLRLLLESAWRDRGLI